MAWMVIVALWKHATWKFARQVPAGTLKRTPVGDLCLQPGDLVRIKPESEILKTLDSRACNRGLRCDGGMRQFCGGEYRVRGRP